HGKFLLFYWERSWFLTCSVLLQSAIGHRIERREQNILYLNDSSPFLERTMRRSTVLVVDDQPAILEVLGVLLGGWGYATDLPGDGVEAKATVQRYDPDIVVSDVRMPEFSGLDLLRVLKSGKPSRPIILMTAHGSVDLAVEAMKQGAQDFLTK